MKFLILAFAVPSYIGLLVWSFRYNILPLLDYYGGWNWLGMNVLFAVLGFVLGFVGAIGLTYTPPTKPQATYKETSS